MKVTLPVLALALALTSLMPTPGQCLGRQVRYEVPPGAQGGQYQAQALAKSMMQPNIHGSLPKDEAIMATALADPRVREMIQNACASGRASFHEVVLEAGLQEREVVCNIEFAELANATHSNDVFAGMFLARVTIKDGKMECDWLGRFQPGPGAGR